MHEDDAERDNAKINQTSDDKKEGPTLRGGGRMAGGWAERLSADDIDVEGSLDMIDAS